MPFNLKRELSNTVKDIKWNFRGILDTEGRLHEIPKNLNFQALFERLVIEKIIILVKKYKKSECSSVVKFDPHLKGIPSLDQTPI